MKVTYLNHMGSDLDVCNYAREEGERWKTGDYLDEKDEKLLHLLASEGHWTPFAHPQVSLRLEMPIFVARQWLRSTVGSVYNEKSRRYRSDTPNMYIPRVLRRRAEKAHTGSSEEPVTDQGFSLYIVESALADAAGAYQTLLEKGVAPEQARIVLPQATYTDVVQTGSLYFWFRVWKQRSDPHAQREVQELAALMAGEVRPLFPKAWSELANYWESSK
jgi:thymidylate synthase (FAD)